MAPWLVRSACDRGSQATLVGFRMGDHFIISSRAFHASEGTLSRWCRHLQSLAPNPHWGRMVGYDLLFLCVIRKEGPCPSSGDINRLMMF
jgi:hypothetical protein